MIGETMCIRSSKSDGLKVRLFACLVMLIALCCGKAQAQTDIRVSGPQAGFPVAIPKLCNAGEAQEQASLIADVISKDLDLSGYFKIIQSSAYIETEAKCGSPESVAYSDWSIIGAEGLVRGSIHWQSDQDAFVVELYLHDVLRQKPVLGKRYTSSGDKIRGVAHAFANEVMAFFTGSTGIFGTRVAYVSRVGRFKELFVMDLDGENVRELTSDRGLVVSPSWSPDGKTILYTSYKTRQPELYSMSPEGSVARQLTKREGLEIGATFSPDGSQIAVGASSSGVTNIVLFNPSGQMRAKLTNGSGIDVSPSWSPDGSQIAFCSNRAGGPQIYVMNSDGRNPRRLSFTGRPYCTSPSLSPKGDRIAFVCQEGGNNLYVVPANGGNATQLTFAGYNEDPSWSPDGSYLLFSTDFGKGGARNLAIMSLSTSKVKQITFSKSENGQPAWSPAM